MAPCAPCSTSGGDGPRGADHDEEVVGGAGSNGAGPVGFAAGVFDADDAGSGGQVDDRLDGKRVPGDVGDGVEEDRERRCHRDLAEERSHEIVPSPHERRWRHHQCGVGTSGDGFVDLCHGLPQRFGGYPAEQVRRVAELGARLAQELRSLTRLEVRALAR